MANEIDSIFAISKKASTSSKFVKKNIQKSTSSIIHLGSGVKSEKMSKSTPKSVAKPQSSSTRKGSASDPFSLASQNEGNTADFTEEGWRIYTPAELNLDKGGDTELCPFDCDCCF